MMIVPVLHNIRSTYNVGAILRTAEGMGLQQVIYSGYTPRYHDTELLPHLRAKLDHQIEKSALGAEKTLAQSYVSDLEDFFREKHQEKSLLLGLENNLAESEKPRQLLLGSPELINQLKLYRDKTIFLLLGEEVAGIPSNLRGLCDYFVEIPMSGRKESFNVSVATGIALWALKNLVSCND